MRRTQIQLTEEQLRRLRNLAASQGRSLADVIRESVDRFIAAGVQQDREALKARARAAIGRFHSSITDLAVNHDRYLAEDFDN